METQVTKDKKIKVTTINDKVVTYTHCIPSSMALVKLAWKQRLLILIAIKVNITINTYLNNGKIQLIILKLNK